MSKISIIFGFQLSNNPWVAKEADVLTEAGHGVEVFSSALNPRDIPPHCRSRDLTITNKISQYLLAGLVVLASNTAGQKEISNAHPNLLHAFQGDSATSLASTSNQIIADQSRIQTDKQETIKLAETKYCWDESKKILLSSVFEALAQKTT